MLKDLVQMRRKDFSPSYRFETQRTEKNWVNQAWLQTSFVVKLSDMDPLAAVKGWV